MRLSSNLSINDKEQSKPAMKQSGSDISSFSKDELAVMNRILMGIFYSTSFDDFIEEIYNALITQHKIKGCALYKVPNNQLCLQLVHGHGIYKPYLPDIIPQGSDLFDSISRHECNSIASESKDQLSLFEDHPVSYFCPIFSESALVGALVIIYTSVNIKFLKIVMDQSIAALELLCRADSFTNDLSIRANFNKEPQDGEKLSIDEKTSGSKLTIREREVLDLLTKGLTNKEIADKLCISGATCKHHVQNILNKLEVHSRAAAVAVGLTQSKNQDCVSYL